jgi:hypothetical protein
MVSFVNASVDGVRYITDSVNNNGVAGFINLKVYGGADVIFDNVRAINKSAWNEGKEGNYTSEVRDAGVGVEPAGVRLVFADFNQSQASASIYVDKNDGDFVLVQRDVVNDTVYNIPSGWGGVYRVRVVLETVDASYSPVLGGIFVSEGSGEDTSPPSISINDPVNASVNSDFFSFSFGEVVNWTGYSVDGGVNVSNDSNPASWSGTFEGLTDGPHSVVVWANDSAGNMASESRYWTRDTVPPSTIESLANQSSGKTWGYWNWTNPTDDDFDHVEIWINGTFRENVTVNNYMATGLDGETWYEIQTRTVDYSGNVNKTWVNDTAKTLVIMGTVKGTVYKPAYGDSESVELIVATMSNDTSIEGSERWVGANFTAEYRVLYPNSSIYLDWTNLPESNYSWANTTFILNSTAEGEFQIQLRPTGEISVHDTINFTTNENNTMPFYRQNIIDAADFILTEQLPNGSFKEEWFEYYGAPARVLMWAWRITGNNTYYNATVNYLEDQINCSEIKPSIYGTSAYAEFQKYSNDTRFQNNLDLCANTLYNDYIKNTIPETWFVLGEASSSLYKAWEVTGNSTHKAWADDLTNDIYTGNSWDANKSTWYVNGQNYLDRIYSGTLTAFQLYWNATLLDYAITAQNEFVPQFYQNGSFGPSPSMSIYSMEIDDGSVGGVWDSDNGHFPHYVAEPVITMLGIYNATNDRRWLLKASLPARWLAEGQEPDGSYYDDVDDYVDSTSDDWVTKWAIWGLYRFPWEVGVTKLNYTDNLTINDAKWNQRDKLLWANVSVPSSETGYVKFKIENASSSVIVTENGVSTGNFTRVGDLVVVWVSGTERTITVKEE